MKIAIVIALCILFALIAFIAVTRARTDEFEAGGGTGGGDAPQRPIKLDLAPGELDEIRKREIRTRDTFKRIRSASHEASGSG